jgi:NTE family protein
MGKVVKLETGGGERSTSPTGETRARARRKRSKTALVLGGGGFTGGVYEIGALRALDLLSVNRTVNEFDVYVGTSAGAFVAGAVANGITPEEMMRVIVQQVPTPFPDARVSALLHPNYRELVTKGALLPLRLAQVVRGLIRDIGSVSAVDLVIGLAEALPSGLYTGDGIERYVRTILSGPDRTDDFRLLARELYLAATDLDTCQRVVLGAEGWDDVPISKAVSASGALPMIYRPVKVKDRELVDGGIVSTTNVDIAVEAGAKFIVVVNPLVPYVNDFQQSIPTLTGSRPRRVSDMGFPQIGYQAFKLLAYQRLHEIAQRWEERYPGVDIILIEPEPNDELHELHLTGGHRAARLSVRDAKAGARLLVLQANLRPARDRDLGHPRAEGGQALRCGAGEDASLAEDPGADHLNAAASVRPSARVGQAKAPAQAGSEWKLKRGDWLRGGRLNLR